MCDIEKSVESSTETVVKLKVKLKVKTDTNCGQSKNEPHTACSSMQDNINSKLNGCKENRAFSLSFQQ